MGSLVDAFQHDRGGNMWVVTTPFEGKTCFRVLWGHYSTPEAGHRALSGAPRVLFDGPEPPGRHGRPTRPFFCYPDLTIR